jgi:hypothetical protein
MYEQGMDEINPYDSPEEMDRGPDANHSLWSTQKCALCGMGIGISIPVAIFVYGMVRVSLAQLQMEPGTPRSGTGFIAALIFLFVGTPFGAIIGVIMGYVVAALRNSWRGKL